MPSHKNKDLKNRPPREVREAQEKADLEAKKQSSSAPRLTDPPVEDGESSNRNLPNPVLLDLVCTFLRYNSLGATATSLEKETQRREAKILKNNSSLPAWKGAAKEYPSLATITTQWAKEHPESQAVQKAEAAASTKVGSKKGVAEDSSDAESDDDSSSESSSEEDSDEDMEDAQEAPVASLKRKAEDSSDSESSEDSSDDSSDDKVVPAAKKQRVSSPESSSEEESDVSEEDEERGVSVKPALTTATTESGAEADEDEGGSTVKAAVNIPLPDSDDESEDETSSEEDSDEDSEDSELEAAADPESGVLDVEAEETSDDDGDDDDDDDDESEDSEDSDDESEESETSVSEDGGAPAASTRATSVDKDEVEDDDDSSDSSISSSDSDDEDDEDDEGTTLPTKDLDDHNSTDSSKTLQATSPTFAPQKDAATLVKELEAMEEPTSGIHPDRLNQMSGYQKPSNNLSNSNIKRKRESLDASTANGTPGSKFQKKQNVPFSRIDRNAAIDPRFADNSYVSYDYADKAHRDLIVTKGKGFTKEKNKKKRGSYKGGFIDDTPRGIKFDD